MSRSSYFVVAGIVLGLASFASAQDPGAKPQVPEDAFSVRELIAWSTHQKPHPTPQPLPPPDKPIPEPGEQGASTTNPNSGDSFQEEAVRTFIGKILRDSDGYALQTDNLTTYRLKGVGDVSQFVSKNVKLEGVLEAHGNTIRVIRITLV
jgi:hypothetical protein